MNITLPLAAVLLIAGISTGSAQITFPNAGTDGALNLTGTYTDYSINLSEATEGPGITWDQSNAARAGKGIYDKDKKAVVFKYTSVTLSASTSNIYFQNHRTRCPVVWLVSGNVTINGDLSLNGQAISYTTSQVEAEPGPGGFRGGIQGGNAAGLGIGGGNNDVNATHASTYGNTAIIPLMGGSGGGGGGAGGGAILIAASGTITINGSITAYGGGSSDGGDGSGGAIRLVANTIGGTGFVNPGTDGRLRLESNNVIAGGLTTTPQTIAVRLPASGQPILWPDSNTASTAKILNVDSVAAPDQPYAPLSLDADVRIEKAAAAASVVTIRTTNFPTTGSVKLRAAGKFNSNAQLITATLVSGGTFAQADWTATVTFATGYTTLQVVAKQ